MKISKSEVHWKARALPEVRFEDQQLTSFAGLIVFQPLFERLRLRQRLRGCFEHLKVSPIFGHASIVTLLIVHLLIGYRRLAELRYYQDDPMVRRVLGLKRLPDVATVSRTLDGVDKTAVRQLRSLSRSLVLERLKELAPARLTLDFDGSVLGTTRMAEGTAVGYNKKKKGQRSYYPLFCTVAQSGQVLDVSHRPGNVHDSNGARAFILSCLSEIRQILPQAILEVRMDSAFFSDEIVRVLEAMAIQYTISVPFERFCELKVKIEKRLIWRRCDRHTSFFACNWKPKCWGKSRRFIFIRTREPIQRKEPVQLGLFTPYVYGYQFKVIVSNSRLSARKLLVLHNGRGAQEGIFAELKSQTQMDYIPCNRRTANQTWLLSAIMAHNLNRELQMSAEPSERGTTEQRAPWWSFVRLGTRRMRLIQRAGRLTRPNGHLTLTMSANPTVQSELLHYLNAAA
ncbi:MAG: IS1380 family transposase [Steroidobacteraceae bacterium]